MPIVPLLHAPYLAPGTSVPLEERPIDLLFFGSMNDRRRAWLDRIRAAGRTVKVACSTPPCTAPSATPASCQARRPCSMPISTTSSRFEQARAAHCLSLGTPVISERTARTRPHAAFEDCVFWLEGTQLEQFFAEDFGTPAFFELGRGRRSPASPSSIRWRPMPTSWPSPPASPGRTPTVARRPVAADAHQPRLGQGLQERLAQPRRAGARPSPTCCSIWPADIALSARSELGDVGPVRLAAGSVSLINANNVLEHVPDLPALMGNCLALLATGGEFHIEVPYEGAATAWQDPTHVRAMNENSWLYYTDWFWYLGWFEYRFAVENSMYLDSQLRPCGKQAAAFMRLVLRKTETSDAERTAARTMQSELRLPDDAVDAAHVYRPAAAGPLRPDPLRSCAEPAVATSL